MSETQRQRIIMIDNTIDMTKKGADPDAGIIVLSGFKEISRAEFYGLNSVGEALLAAIKGAFMQGVKVGRDARRDAELREIEKENERFEAMYDALLASQDEKE